MTAAIRRATRADADAILELEKEFPGDRMSLRSVRRFIAAPSAVVLVADAPPVLGALVLLLRRGSAVARIYSVAVSARARGQGLGAKLVQAAEAAARKRSCATVSLEVRADNAAARALYAKLRYREVRVLPDYYEDGAEGIRLLKLL